MSGGAPRRNVAAGAAPSSPGSGVTSTSFGPLKQVKAGELNVGYAEVGPARGPAVILLHGWPYDIYCFAGVAPLLAAEGYRVIVPYLRGYGTTRFLSSRTLRNGQQSVFAVDALALMDALKIDKAILSGFDWGGRAAEIVASIWPERCKALVSAGGYLVINLEKYKKPAPPETERAYWYQYYFATERGVLGLQENRRDLAELVWTVNSPTWKFSQATFDRTAAAFDNPDYVSIVIDNYRWRLGLAPGDPRLNSIEQKLTHATIGVPSIIIDGKYDPFTLAGDGASYRSKFTGKYAHWTLDVGHDVPQEAPRDFAQAILDAGHL
jgi:pimeloyl-ACP methyl ester carboxylesterase